MTSLITAAALSLFIPADAWWNAGEADASHLALRQRVISAVEPAELRAAHERLGSEPHLAGTDGDWRTIERLTQMFKSAGLKTDVHEIWPLLTRPVKGRVQVMHQTRGGDQAERRFSDFVQIRERALTEDTFTASTELTIGFNAYSASGTAEGEVVYANYGTREDFQLLRERGVDCMGKIVIARYGHNFRGYKALYAEQAGAAGLIIYTDPKDSGSGRGEPYPEGGWANETSIQRGSIVTLPYPGDPLTPFTEATNDAPRLDPEAIDLPRIPVQPVGWDVARQILELMDGEEAPASWQGGLPLKYRFTASPALRVAVTVEQPRDVMRTANVIATLPGASEPDKFIIVGCHHDAWCHGASDPLAGTIVLTELARVFGEAANEGVQPARSIIFAAWGAEEYGIIGSTEWCEANRDMLSAGAVAYINLDMAAMGLRFGSSSSPSLRSAIAHAASVVEHPSPGAGSVLNAWLAQGNEPQPVPSFGSMGGGSDHVGFYCHLGVPSCSVGGGGSEGTAYHSNYDTIAWYQKVVGSDYASAHMVTQVCAALVAELANARVLPLDPRGYGEDGLAQLEKIEARANELGVDVDFAPVRHAMHAYGEAASAFVDDVQRGEEDIDVARVNDVLLRLERAWLSPEGLPGRPWFMNLYGASDPYSGYAAWVFPALRLAIEEKDAMAAAMATARIVEVYDAMAEQLAR